MAILENNKLQKFENQSIRTAWDEENEEWYFSVVDAVKVLTEQKTARGTSNYWAKIKERLKTEGFSQEKLELYNAFLMRMTQNAQDKIREGTHGNL